MIDKQTQRVYLSFWIAWIMVLSESGNNLESRAANTNPMKEMEPTITKKPPQNFIFKTQNFNETSELIFKKELFSSYLLLLQLSFRNDLTDLPNLIISLLARSVTEDLRYHSYIWFMSFIRNLIVTGIGNQESNLILRSALPIFVFGLLGLVLIF